MTPDQHLRVLLLGNPRGLTRAQLTHRLNQPDRAVRQLIEDVVARGELPVVADRTQGGEAHYRIAGRDEIELVTNEHRELVNRALSMHKRAKGLLLAWESHHASGNLFSPVTPELS